MSNEMITASRKSKKEYHMECQYYMDIIDPESGKPYEASVLPPWNNHKYLSEYASLMRLKEKAPALFERILKCR